MPQQIVFNDASPAQAPPSSALTTVSAVKQHLGITGSTDDALLAQMVLRAQASIERHCSRQFAADTYTEDLDGGGQSLIVSNAPIRTLVSVSWLPNDGDPIVVSNDRFTVDSDAGTITIQDRRWHPYFESVGERRRFGPTKFGQGKRCWRVVYAGGFLTVPPDLEQICIEVVKSMYLNRRVNGSMQMENIGGGASFTLRAVQEAIDQRMHLLASFVRYGA